MYHRLQILTLDTTTLGDTNDVNELILVKNGVDSNGFLQVTLGPLHFVRDGPAIQLDLHDVSLLLALAQQLHLKGTKNVTITGRTNAQVSSCLCRVGKKYTSYLTKEFFLRTFMEYINQYPNPSIQNKSQNLYTYKSNTPINVF